MSHQRDVELVVISDVHLGTYGCRAQELLGYLRSIRPAQVVLNGDIFDAWQFSRRYFPRSHMQVIQHLVKWSGQGIPMHYVTGNHDETMRRFVGARLGSCRVVNQVVLPLGGRQAWFFHGDVFDASMQGSRRWARLGANGYGALVVCNRFVNRLVAPFGGRVSFSRAIKNGVKNAIKAKSHFEQTAADAAIARGYDYVVCGHIHQPALQTLSNADGRTTYLNSGDWVENLTALEYHGGAWRIYRHEAAPAPKAVTATAEAALPETTVGQLFQNLLKEFAV